MLRAYEQRTGAVIWQDPINYGGRFAVVNGVAVVDEDDDYAPPSATLDLFAVGRGQRADGKTEWFIRAYDQATGALAWQDTVDGTRINDAVSVTTREGRVFAAGFTTDRSPLLRHFTVRA